MIGYGGFAERTRELTGNRGVAVVYDGVGRATFDDSLASLRPRGYMVLYGAASGQVEPVDPQRLHQGRSLYLTRPGPPHYRYAPRAAGPRAPGVRLDRRPPPRRADRRALPAGRGAQGAGGPRGAADDGQAHPHAVDATRGAPGGAPRAIRRRERRSADAVRTALAGGLHALLSRLTFAPSTMSARVRPSCATTCAAASAIWSSPVLFRLANVSHRVVARVVRLARGAAVDGGLLRRLDALGAGEEAARRDALR